MPAPQFDKGDQLTSTATFTNAAGALTNPTLVTFYTQSPSGVETAYVNGTAPEVTSTATGVFTLTFTPSAVGEWLIVARGTGAVAQVDKERIEILATGIAVIDA